MCSELAGKAMGAMPWTDGALDRQLIHTYDAYAWHKGAMPCALRGNSHGRNAMAHYYGA